MANLAAGNADMAAAWDGQEGEHWTVQAYRYDRAGQGYDRHLLERAAIGARDRVLDIGCGSGVSTRMVARVATSGSALGVDLSARMLEHARECSFAEGLTNTSYEQGDAQVHPFEPASFDAVISRFGAMFFADPVGAFQNIATALRPGARLTLLSWRTLEHNEWVVALRTSLAAGRTLPDRPPGVPGPFGLAEAEAIRRILGRAGFEGIELMELNEPMLLGSDVDDAFSFVRGMGMSRALLDGLDASARERALKTLREQLAKAKTAAGVVFASSAWLIAARRA